MIGFTVQYQTVRLKVDDENQSIMAKSRIWLHSVEKLDASAKLLLQCRASSISKIEVNNQAAAYAANDPFRHLAECDNAWGSRSSKAPIPSYAAEELDCSFRAAFELSQYGELVITLPEMPEKVPAPVDADAGADTDATVDADKDKDTGASSSSSTTGQYLLISVEYKIDINSSGIVSVLAPTDTDSFSLGGAQSAAYPNPGNRGGLFSRLQGMYTCRRAGRSLDDVDGVRSWLPCIDCPSQRNPFDISLMNIPQGFDCICSGTKVSKTRSEAAPGKFDYRFVTTRTCPMTLGWFVGRVEKYTMPLYQCYGRMWVVVEPQHFALKRHSRAGGGTRSVPLRQRLSGGGATTAGVDFDDELYDDIASEDDCSDSEEEEEPVAVGGPARARSGSTSSAIGARTEAAAAGVEALVYGDLVSHTTLGLDLGLRYVHKFLAKAYNYNTYTQVFVPGLCEDTMAFDGFSLVNSQLLHSAEQVYMETPVHVQQIASYLSSWLMTSVPVESFSFEFLIHGAVQYVLNVYLEYLYGEETGHFRFLRMFDTVVQLEKSGRSFPLVTVYPEAEEKLQAHAAEYALCKAAVLFHLIEHRVGSREPMRQALKHIVQSPEIIVPVSGMAHQKMAGRPMRVRSSSQGSSMPTTPRDEHGHFPPPTPGSGNFPPPTPGSGNFPPPTPGSGNFPPPTPGSGPGQFPPPTPHGVYGTGNFAPPTPYWTNNFAPPTPYGTNNFAPPTPYGTNNFAPPTPYGTNNFAPPTPYGTNNFAPPTPYGTNNFAPPTPIRDTSTAISVGSVPDHFAQSIPAPLSRSVSGQNSSVVKEGGSMPAPTSTGMGPPSTLPSRAQQQPKERSMLPRSTVPTSQRSSAPPAATINFVNPNQLLSMVLSHGGGNVLDLNDDFIDKYMFDNESVLFVRCSYRMESKPDSKRSRLLTVKMETVSSDNRVRNCNFNDSTLAVLLSKKEDVRFRVVESHEDAITGPQVTEAFISLNSKKVESYTQHISVTGKRGPQGKRKDKDAGAASGVVVASRDNPDQKKLSLSVSTQPALQQQDEIKTILFDPYFTRLTEVFFFCPSDSLIREQVNTPFASGLGGMYHIRALRALLTTANVDRNSLFAASGSSAASEALAARYRSQLKVFLEVVSGTGEIQHDLYVRAEAAYCIAAWQNDRAPVFGGRDCSATGGASSWDGLFGLLSALTTLFVDEDSGIPTTNDLLNEPNLYLCHALLFAVSSVQAYGDCTTPHSAVQMLLYFTENHAPKSESRERNYDESDPTATAAAMGPSSTAAGGNAGNRTRTQPQTHGQIVYDDSYHRALLLVCLSRVRLGQTHPDDIELNTRICEVAQFQLHKDLSDAYTNYYVGNRRFVSIAGGGVVSAAAISCLAQADIHRILSASVDNPERITELANRELALDYRSYFEFSSASPAAAAAAGSSRSSVLLIASASTVIQAAALEAFVRVSLAKFIHGMKVYRQTRATAAAAAAGGSAVGTPGGGASIKASALANVHMANAISTVCGIISSPAGEHTLAFKRRAAAVLLDALQDRDLRVATAALGLGEYTLGKGWGDPRALTLTERRRPMYYMHNQSTTFSPIVLEYKTTMLKCKGKAMKVAVRSLWSLLAGDSALRYDQSLRSTLMAVWVFSFGNKVPLCLSKEETASVSAANGRVPVSLAGVKNALFAGQERMMRPERLKRACPQEAQERICKHLRVGVVDAHNTSRAAASLTHTIVQSRGAGGAQQPQKPREEREDGDYIERGGSKSSSTEPSLRLSLTRNENGASSIQLASPIRRTGSVKFTLRENA